jgi:hypothetical protein
MWCGTDDNPQAGTPPLELARRGYERIEMTRYLLGAAPWKQSEKRRVLRHMKLRPRFASRRQLFGTIEERVADERCRYSVIA